MPQVHAQSTPPSPLGLTSRQYADACAGQGLCSAPAAIQRYARFFREGPSEFPDLAPRPLRTLVSESPEGTVTKFLLPVPAGDPATLEHLETESVIIPMLRRHETTFTLCVSSQIGCAMGCVFCETAQMGLLRSLTPAEIVAQWYAARHYLGQPIRNIVFMGMGEPLDNYDNLIQALACLTDHYGPSVGASRITISTVGRTDGLRKLADHIRAPGFHKLNLAVSINAPSDDIRSRIMPINRSSPLGELIPILESWPMRRSSAICVEYVLIPGVNDAMEHADELCLRLRAVRCCVNVIPYNPRRNSPWPAPDEDLVARFLARLESRGQFCKRRRTKGRDTMAACGQLGNEHIRRRRLVPLGTPTAIPRTTRPA